MCEPNSCSIMVVHIHAVKLLEKQAKCLCMNVQLDLVEILVKLMGYTSVRAMTAQYCSAQKTPVKMVSIVTRILAMPCLATALQASLVVSGSLILTTAHQKTVLMMEFALRPLDVLLPVIVQ